LYIVLAYSFQPAEERAAERAGRYGTSPRPLNSPPMKITAREAEVSPDVKKGYLRPLGAGKMSRMPGIGIVSCCG